MRLIVTDSTFFSNQISATPVLLADEYGGNSDTALTVQMALEF